MMGLAMRKTKREKSTYLVDTETAINQYADMVYRIAIVQMKNKSDADDIFQEVFIRLVKYKETIESEEHLKAWLIRVTTNCCNKQFTSAWNKKTTFLESEDDISETYEIEEQDETVFQAVKQLPENYKSVIHLFYYEEYSVKEIAQILEQSESTIKTRLSRARQMLRKNLGGSYDEE
jgi:RNA polymerase sigma-70 factor, ECF subfamily